ncbi:sigma factor [Streptomyces albidoflavus]
MLRPGALPLVYNVIGRAAESDLDVDDIVQDTMVAVIRALPELRETRSSAPGWWPSRSASSPTPGAGRAPAG